MKRRVKPANLRDAVNLTRIVIVAFHSEHHRPHHFLQPFPRGQIVRRVEAEKMTEVTLLDLRAAELIKDDVACHAGRNRNAGTVTRRLDSICRFCFAETATVRHDLWPVKSVTIQINDLFEFEGQPVPAQRPDNGIIEAMARRQFEFLRQPLQIEISDNAVTVSFSEESAAAQDEAVRLAERAGKRAAEGNYDKAISLWKRVLELHPSLHKARRDLAMASMETGDIEGAKNHLIEVLRLNPSDPWGWVVLGNLYAKNEKDWPTAEKFLRRALEIAPNDAWALNGLAAMTAQRGLTDRQKSLVRD